MTYRDLPPKPPLVVCSDVLIQAFDASTGRPLWQKPLAGGGYARIASSGERVLIAVKNKAHLIDMPTGDVLLEMTLAFDAQAALADGDTLVVMGKHGLACFDSTGYVWGIRAHVTPSGRAFVDANVEFWLENARGERVSQVPDFVPWRASRSDLGMVLGRSVFQPDIDT
jgi:hypothetical protein